MRLASAVCFGIGAAIAFLYGLYIIEDTGDVSWGWIGLAFIGLGGVFLALSDRVWPVRR